MSSATLERESRASLGLTAEEVAQRIADGRVNKQPSDPDRTIGQIFQANLLTPVNAVLFTLLILILAAQRPGDALFVGVIASNIIIGTAQELKARRELRKLAVLTTPKAAAVRNGDVVDLNVEEVVADDVLHLVPGAQVVVDGEVLTSTGLEVDESLLTGESDPLYKAPGDEVLSGSFVTAGSGRYSARKIGAEGYAAALSEEARRFKPVQSELRIGVNWIIRALTWLIPIASGLLLWRLLTLYDDWRDAISGVVAASVAMVPDGLVLLTSLTFLAGVVALAKRKALAKELATVELLARVDVLCLDKTGTITTGEISFERLEAVAGFSEGDVRAVLGAMVAADPAPNPTLASIGEACEAPEGWRTVALEPFSSARKWAAAEFAGDGIRGGLYYLGAPDILLSEDPTGGRHDLADGRRDLADGRRDLADGRRDLADGLADGLSGNGELSDGLGDDLTTGALSEDLIRGLSGDISDRLPALNKPPAASGDAEVRRRVEELSAEGWRVLLLSAADASLTDFGGEGLAPRRRAAAVIVLGDTVRADAADTLAYFKRQDVKLKVISGDNPATVAAVAKRVGVKNAEHYMDARELADRNAPEGEDGDAALREVVERTTVFGRVTPHQKREMLKALQANGHTVAMTGDGVNDVLALKDADMGVAMGSGSSASKAVAELVLLDNSFATLPKVLEEGRKVINNVERVANLFIAKAAYALLITAVIALMGAPFPFLPRHLTLIGTFSIGLPGLVLALAPSTELVRPHFLRRVLRFSIPAGLAGAACTIGVYEIVRRAQGISLEQARTAAVLTLLGVGLAILVVVSRPLRPWKLGLAALMALLYALVMGLSFGRSYFHLHPPPGWVWGVIIGGFLLGAVAVALIPRLDSKLESALATAEAKGKVLAGRCRQQN